MAWDFAVGGVTDEVPRTIGPECENYMTNRRRLIESILFCILFILLMRWAMRRLEPIHVPVAKVEGDQQYSAMRIGLLLAMTLIFGIEMGFKLANRSVIFVLNPCHIQTLVQIYLLAAKPSKLTITMFRIQMNNLNGPVLAFLFPEVECRTLPFEQATYWIQHALLYIIPVYILRSGAYQVEDLSDFNWSIIGVEVQLIYHFTVLNYGSMYTGINLNHMLCAAQSDPFQGENYRVAAVIHESILCPILNKLTVYMFATPRSIQYSAKGRSKTNQINTTIKSMQDKPYEKLTLTQRRGRSASMSMSSSSLPATVLHEQPPAHKTATMYSKQYLHDEAPSCSSSSSAGSQLMHRVRSMSASREYHQRPHELRPLADSHAHHLHQRRHHPQQLQQPQPHHPPESETAYGATYILAPEPDLELKQTITTEYTMPTTKID